MQARFHRVITAVVATLLAEVEPPDDLRPGAEAFTAAFVIAQVDRMPAHLRTAMLALETLFDAGAIARYGRPFHRLGRAQRAAYLATWARSPLRPQRDFVRFHRSLAVFALYSARTRAA